MPRKTAISVNLDRHERQLSRRQMDLFRSGLTEGGAGAPAWPDLPKEAQDALVGLMMQLILDHVRAGETAQETEAGHDL